MSKPRIGYALSGGAVRGVAHLGFLSVFEEAGIRPDVIAGTSAGAIVGAGYAAGLTVEQMSQMAKACTWRQVTGVPRMQPMSVFASTPLSAWIENVIGDVNIEDLDIPYAAVACDIVEGTRVVLTHGPVVEAAIASAAVPGLFAPVERDDMLLVDGGILDNLPVDVARSLGADMVVAVDVSSNLKAPGRPENLRDVMSCTLNIVASTNLWSRQEAEFLVQPKTEEFTRWDFARIQEIIDAGREAALPVVDEVLAALG